MKTVWDASSRRELQDRLGRLTPQSERKWGRMSTPHMMAHLVDAMRMVSGEIVVPSKNLPIRHAPLKQLIIYWLPFPKGAPTAPQLISRPPADWSTECAMLATMIDRLPGLRDESNEWPEHPAFGKLTSKAWGVLIYRHIDHHFRQFGV
jgi:hypothetical protein